MPRGVPLRRVTVRCWHGCGRRYESGCRHWRLGGHPRRGAAPHPRARLAAGGDDPDRRRTGDRIRRRPCHREPRIAGTGGGGGGVAALPVRKATLDIPVIRQEVEARGQRHSFRLLSQAEAVPPVPVASRLGLGPEQRMIYLETLHLADGQPFVFETRWLNPLVLPAPLPDFATVSANEWLVAHVAYALGDIAFSAAGATPREAAVLGVAEGAALFITERTTWTAEAPITAVRLAHAPGYRVQTLV